MRLLPIHTMQQLNKRRLAASETMSRTLAARCTQYVQTGTSTADAVRVPHGATPVHSRRRSRPLQPISKLLSHDAELLAARACPWRFTAREYLAVIRFRNIRHTLFFRHALNTLPGLFSLPHRRAPSA
jgi:hypothetical protein